MLQLIFEILVLSAGFNIITLSIVLFYKKRIPSPQANVVFTCMLFVMTVYSILITVEFFAVNYELNSLLVHYMYFEDIIFLLYPIAVFLFVRSIICANFKLNSWINYLHLLSLLPFAFYAIYFIQLKPENRVDILHQNYQSNTAVYVLFNFIMYIQVFIYLLLSFYYITKQLKKSNYVLHGNTHYDISWIKRFIVANIVYTVITIPFYCYFKNDLTKIVITQIGMEFQFLYFFLRWLLNIEGFMFKSSKLGNTLKPEEEVSSIQQKILTSYMIEHKPYLNDKCTIQFVAERTGISVHQLSSLINCTFGKSFSDYVNEFRVNEAKQMLSKQLTMQTTIESIGTECGFGSKSTFYRVFKKHTNQTPVEYLKDQTTTK